MNKKQNKKEKAIKDMEKNFKKIFRVLLENEDIFSGKSVYKHIHYCEETKKAYNAIKSIEENRSQCVARMEETKDSNSWKNARIKNVKDKERYVSDLIAEICNSLMNLEIITVRQMAYYTQKLGDIREEYDKLKIIDATSKYFLEMENGGVEGHRISFLPFRMRIGELFLIAGFPGVGKTDFIIKMAEELCDKNKKVDLFSLEIPITDVFERMAGSDAIFGERKRGETERGLEYFDFKPNAKEIIKMINKRSEFLRVIPGNYSDLSWVEKMIKDSPSTFIIIDYLGEIESNKKFKNSFESSDFIISRLRKICEKYNKIIFVISTLNKSDSKGIGFQNVSGGSAIRHKPHGIIGLDKGEDGYIVHVIKNRNGSTRSYKIQFDYSTKVMGKAEYI